MNQPSADTQQTQPGSAWGGVLPVMPLEQAGPLPALAACAFGLSFMRTLADVGEMKTRRNVIFHAPELLRNSNSNHKSGKFIVQII